MTIVVVMLLFMSLPVRADCVPEPDGEISISIKSCEVLSPDTTPKLISYKKDGYGLPSSHTDDFLNLYFRGGLIMGTVGKKDIIAVYPSSDATVCKQFNKGMTVKKILTNSCCDTGEWGKCLYGGLFLYDVGGKPVDAFQ